MAETSMQILLRDMLANHYDYPNLLTRPQFYFNCTTKLSRIFVNQTYHKYFLCSTLPIFNNGAFENTSRNTLFWSSSSENIEDIIHDYFGACLKFVDKEATEFDGDICFVAGFVECSLRYHHYRWHVSYKGLALPYQDNPLLNATQHVYKSKTYDDASDVFYKTLYDVCTQCDEGYHS